VPALQDLLECELIMALIAGGLIGHSADSAQQPREWVQQCRSAHAVASKLTAVYTVRPLRPRGMALSGGDGC
jgi:hypothetical protein